MPTTAEELALLIDAKFAKEAREAVPPSQRDQIKLTPKQKERREALLDKYHFPK